MELIISNDNKKEMDQIDVDQEKEEQEGQTEQVEVLTATKPEQAVKQEVCVELKNIQYKTMLLKGTPMVESKLSLSSDNIDNLDKFLENEKTANMNDSWSNIDKTSKLKKLMVYAETYKNEHNLTEDEYNAMLKFLKESLDHKKLQRVKDVSYDKVTGIIKSIPALNFNKTTNHFTLKNVDKRVSTLKSLPPKKTRGTVKMPHV